MRTRLIALLLLSCAALSARADGLIVPSTTGYPKDLLRNRMTRISVSIRGLSAETVVYQEFVNEWNMPVNGVYNFPLPPDARATAIYYWRGDTLFRAVLKVKEQSTNPGTGEEGVAALVNAYIGLNGLKMELAGIPAGGIQKVELHYVSLCAYDRGVCEYRYPLDTRAFVTWPLEHLQATIDAESSTPILSYALPGHPSFRELRREPGALRIDMTAPKSYADHDLLFRYTVAADSLSVDCTSAANDTADGHFALFVRPPGVVPDEQVLPRRFVFALSRSTRMSPLQLAAGLAAVGQALDQLRSSDHFGLLSFSYSTTKWRDTTVPATGANIALAKSWLASLSPSSGSRLDDALVSALGMMRDAVMNNAILAFTDGRSPIDPDALARLNTKQTAIALVGIGTDLERSRLELTAAKNNGFVAYIDATENITAGLLAAFARISRPVIRDARLEFGGAIHSVRPLSVPALCAGSFFFCAGRYSAPGEAPLSVFGTASSGIVGYDFRLQLSGEKAGGTRVEALWAKLMLDDLEQRIDVYGETPVLRDSAILLSLRYGIRCRYTAYIADYKNVISTTSPAADHGTPATWLLGNAPNPFSTSTTITVRIDAETAAGAPRVIRIYDLLGRLVAEIDISHLGPGIHLVPFDARSLLPGAYIAVLQSGTSYSTLRMIVTR